MGIPQPIAKLLRLGLLTYLTGSVLYTVHYGITSYSSSSSSSGTVQDVRPRMLTEPGQAIFEMDSIVHSDQIVEWKSKDKPTRGINTS